MTRYAVTPNTHDYCRKDTGLKNILFVYGTRPEAIKMAPLVLEFKKYPEKFDVCVCLTGQHKQMLDPVNAFFGITPDCNLELMQQNQTLTSLTSRCLLALDPLLIKFEPDIVFVQGDTTTVLAAALAAYYRKIPVAHLEAGLRSGNKYSPFPEELNRKITSQIAEYHFAPTAGAANNLKKENITKNVYVVGNTVIDALHLGLKIISGQGEEEYRDYFSFDVLVFKSHTYGNQLPYTISVEACQGLAEIG